MTLTPPKQWFWPYSLGSSLNESFSFSPYTFVTQAPQGERFTAKTEANGASKLHEEISATYAEIIGDFEQVYLETGPTDSSTGLDRDYFLLWSSDNAQATISATYENLRSTFIACNETSGCIIWIWTRIKNETLALKQHIPKGLTLLKLEASILDDAIALMPEQRPTLSDQIVFITVSATATPLSPRRIPIYIKPIRLQEDNSDTGELHSYSSIPFGNRHRGDQDIISRFPTACQLRRVSVLDLQSAQAKIRIASKYFEELLGNRITPNPRHLTAMISNSIGSLDSLPSLSQCISSAQTEKTATSREVTNYLIVMTPRSGSTALSEKFAKLGIGCPTELTTGYFYNLFSHLESSAQNQTYLNYMFDLLRNPCSLASGIQIDPDRLKNTWQQAIDGSVAKYIYFFRRSISKQALSLALAVHHGLWFAYGPERYNSSLERLSLAEYQGQLRRLVGMNLYCIDHYLKNKDCSTILTNEQHLKAFSNHSNQIIEFITRTGESNREKPKETESCPSAEGPTKEIGGRDRSAINFKIKTFLDELDISSTFDFLKLCPESSAESKEVFLNVFTI